MTTIIGYALAGLIGIGIIFIGARFLIVPVAAVGAFGIPEPAPLRDAFHEIKGVRDIASGVFLLILIANGDPDVLGWIALAACLIPLGDAVIVLRHGGTKAAALGIHGATVVLGVVTAVLLLV